MKLCLNTLYKFTAQTQTQSAKNYAFAKDIPNDMQR